MKTPSVHSGEGARPTEGEPSGAVDPVLLANRGGIGGDRPAASSARRRGGGAGFVDLLVVLSLSFLSVFGIVRPFVAEPFLIPSGSMSPTLEPGDRVLALKPVYRLAEPARGDLAIFDDGDGAVIKRVVGLSGDTISVEDGVLVVNGERVYEPYVDYPSTDSSFFGPETVPEGHVFVMGDNRSNSRDSRATGPVPEEDLIGRVVLRFWPAGRAGGTL